MTHRSTIHLGFEVGTGAPVEIPLAHTFVTGQTQLSGKTTTLRAIVERSGQRALAFVTKRGEEFDGRRVLPYLPREGAKPIHWRLVETLLASALGQRNMKWERFQIVNAVKGAYSLVDVRRNVDRLKAKGGKAADIYELLGEYLDLILPEMRELAAADTLDLQPGLNVMDLGGVGPQLQALVIRAALEQINQHERGVLTVFPEAWEFAPRARSAPAKDEAIAMARKGAVLGNFLLCDSQDIAGVDTVIRQATSVWILGVQREINELKRTIDSIPAGIAKPKAADVATLELGQFFACWGRHVVRTYVQPAWMKADDAETVARNSPHVTVEYFPRTGQYAIGGRQQMVARRRAEDSRQEEQNVTKDEAARLTRENEQLKADNAELRRRLEALEASHGKAGTDRDGERMGGGRAGSPSQPRAERAKHDGGADRIDRASAPIGEVDRHVRPEQSVGKGGPRAGRTFTVEESFDNEALYQAFKARLIEEAPAVVELLTARPEVLVTINRPRLSTEGETLKGRILTIMTEGFFAEPKSCGQIRTGVKRIGPDANTANIGRVMDELVRLGFVTDEGSGYRIVANATSRIQFEEVGAR